MIISFRLFRFKLTNNRFKSNGKQSKEYVHHVEAPRKDPDEEVFGKKQRTGYEVVDELVSGDCSSLIFKRLTCEEVQKKKINSRLYETLSAFLDTNVM